jgi:serine/threonine protein kinase
MTLRDGRPIGGRYELGRKIAEGGMGAVYEARHLLSQRTVALKILYMHASHDEAATQRFLREASASARIGHPGIVEVLDAGVDEDGSYFVAMELLEGATVRQRLSQRAGPAAIFSLFEQILEPIAAAHEKGFVHRDLKPENIFVARTPAGEKIKILDFGIVRELSDERAGVTQPGAAMGTPPYMAPEQAMNARDVTAAADVWALGIMLYEAIAGGLPFAGETPTAMMIAVASEPHAPIAVKAPQTPSVVAALVDRCLSKDARLRPANAGQLLAELKKVRRALETGATVANPPSTPPTRPGPAASDRPPAYGAPGYGAMSPAPFPPGYGSGPGYAHGPNAPPRYGTPPGYASAAPASRSGGGNRTLSCFGVGCALLLLSSCACCGFSIYFSQEEQDTHARQHAESFLGSLQRRDVDAALLFAEGGPSDEADARTRFQTCIESTPLGQLSSFQCHVDSSIFETGESNVVCAIRTPAGTTDATLQVASPNYEPSLTFIWFEADAPTAEAWGSDACARWSGRDHVGEPPRDRIRPRRTSAPQLETAPADAALAPSDAGSIPDTPSRSDFLAAMNTIEPNIERCGSGHRGIVTMRFEFEPSGSATRVRVQGGSLPEDVTACMEREGRMARVPPFSRSSFTGSHPFRL